MQNFKFEGRTVKAIKIVKVYGHDGNDELAAVLEGNEGDPEVGVPDAVTVLKPMPADQFYEEGSYYVEDGDTKKVVPSWEFEANYTPAK